MSKQTVRSEIKSFTKTVFDLNAGRLKKILFATGFLVLGMCTAVESAYATPVVTGIDKGTYDGKTRVEVKITETDREYEISGLSYTESGGESTVLENDKIINWNDVKWKNNEGKKEAIVALEVPAGAVGLVATSKNILNNSDTKDSEELAIGSIQSCEGPKVKDGTLIKYHSEEYGDYIQAQFTGTSRIWKITDVDDKNVVELNEKEQDTTVTLKYILTPGQQYFNVYDIVGHHTTRPVSSAVDVTFNARTKDGSRFVLGVSETIEQKIDQDDVTYTLDSIQTGVGQDIDYHSGNAMYGKKDANDNEDADLNEIVGVTRLKLTYKATGHADIVVDLPLILDKTSPEVVGYVAKLDSEGTYIVEKIKANVRNVITDNTGETVKLRAYVNNKTDKCIVEVRDVQSGIDTIKLLKGSDGAYKLIEDELAQREGYDSNGKLEASVLHLFSFKGLKDRVTAVRVTDGLGNEFDVPVQVSTVDNKDTIIHAELEEYPDDNGKLEYRVVAQDYKAGLWKIERDTDDENVKQVLVNFESPEVNGIIVQELDENGVPKDVDSSKIPELLEIAGQDYSTAYEQYTLGRVVRNINKEGQPVIMVYDALGNARQVSFDDIAFACYYATYNQEGSLALSIKETRGIWKITTSIVSPKDELREDACKYSYVKNGAVVTEIPVDSNEPLYDGEVPSNGSEEEPGKEFFITTRTSPNGNDNSNPIPLDYVAANDNRPKYITSEGKEVVPNNGLSNSNAYGEYFDTEGESTPGYVSLEDNRPKYTGKVPQVGVNEPKYNGAIPSANEPKYNGLVPSSTNEPKYTKPDGTKVVAEDANEPKYTAPGEEEGRVPGDTKYNGLVPSLENEPKYIEPNTETEQVPHEIKDNEYYVSLSPEEQSIYEEKLREHETWLAAKTAYEYYNGLEASEKAKYQAALNEHKKWEKAKEEHAIWATAMEDHEEWQDVMTEYNKWKDTLEDYKEWKSVLAEYKKWKIANAEHIKWQNAKNAHDTWEEDSITEYTLEIFRDSQEPSKLIKTYEVPDGVVKKVTVYHEHDRDDLYNEITTVAHKKVAALQDISELEPEEVICTTVGDVSFDNGEVEQVKVTASRGIKLVEYNDGTVVEFNKDLPTDLCIDCGCVSGEGLLVTVTDAVGFQLNIYSNKVEYNEFGGDRTITNFTNLTKVTISAPAQP